MSSHHNRRKRRSSDQPPVMVERIQQHEQGHEGKARLTYEEANWAKLSPTFRDAHNRLRVARGLTPIPAPTVDLYVAPPKSVIKPINTSDPEYQRALTEYREPRLLAGGEEGFTINGQKFKW